MDSFLKLFGNYTVADAVTVILVIVFIYGIYNKIKPCIKNKFNRGERMNDIVENYQEWRQQSINIQKQLSDAIDELKLGQERNSKRLEQIDSDNKKREINRLRDRLLQSYRYYTSSEKNPMHAWSEMESDVFWSIFADYEGLGGNGHMHTEVQPEMRRLIVVHMDEHEKLIELMQSRK